MSQIIPSLLFKFLTSNHLHYAFHVRCCFSQYFILKGPPHPQSPKLLSTLKLILKTEANLRLGSLECPVEVGDKKKYRQGLHSCFKNQPSVDLTSSVRY